MFVRAVWRDNRFIETKVGLRASDGPATHDPRLPGVAASDLAKMTRGLFDR